MTVYRSWPRPWDISPDVDPQTIGPIDVPWSSRRFYLSVQSGKIVIAVQHFKIEKKTLALIDTKKFRDKNIRENPSTGIAVHGSGAPMMTLDDATEVFDIADKKDIPLAHAYVEWAIKNEVDLSPSFLKAAKNAPRVYTIPSAERLRAIDTGLTPEKELEDLEVKAAELRARIDVKKAHGVRRRKEAAPAS